VTAPTPCQEADRGVLRVEHVGAARRPGRDQARRDRCRPARRPGDGASLEHLREPLGILQGALVGFKGLVLAFGLSLAVGRYESRRADVANEANAIGTTYLRAQTLDEPV
jgi:hypothetical protein